MKFSGIEIQHLLKAWGALSIAFAIAFGGLNLAAFPFALVFSAITVGIGFVFHELSHKFFAQKYNCWAEFRADNKMLFMTILISFTGFIFAAPGGVFIQGRHLTPKQNGVVSLAGPAMNIVASTLFFILGSFSYEIAWLNLLADYGYRINAWLALFNLLPFGPLDGTKVLAWNKWVYGVAIGASAILLFLGSILTSSF